MKLKNLRHITLSLFAALTLAGIGVTQVHALTLLCSTNRTVECGTTWMFNQPVAAGACGSNVTVHIISSNSSYSVCSASYTRTWEAQDGCTNAICSQTITVMDATPPLITCAGNKPARSGTVWAFDRPFAYDACCGTNLSYWFLGSNVVSSSQCQTVWAGRWQVSDCCSNYSSTCTQFVTVANSPAPYLTILPAAGPLGSGRLGLNWADTCGELAIESRFGFGSGGPGGGSGWVPAGGLPKASWDRVNQTNNMVERVFTVDFPSPTGDPASGARFFRLTSDASIGRDFSSVATGPYTNPAAQPTEPDYLTFSRPGGGAMEIVSINDLHVLQVDDRGIAGLWPPNIPTYPSVLTGPPGFHEAELFVVGYVNDNGPTCLFLKAFDVLDQLVDATMTTNAFATVTLRSQGFPLKRVEVVAEPSGLGGLVSMKGRTDYALSIDLLTECLDFTSYPTGAVANPWVLPGHTITARDSSSNLETNTFIEPHLDGFGNGYHVEHSVTIDLTTNCCRNIRVELVAYSLDVQVEARDETGAPLEARPVTTLGTPVFVEFPPTTAPICKVVVKAPGGLTRILRICCLPAVQPISPPDFPPPGTNSNPLVAGPLTFQVVSGGLFGPLVTYFFLHNNYTNHTVFDVANESLVALATPCNRVVLEVFSENATGMELEAADAFGFVVSRAGPLDASTAPQTVLLSGSGIKTVRFKCPAGEGSLINIYGLPQ